MAETKASRSHTREKTLEASIFGTNVKRSCNMYGAEKISFLALSETLFEKRGAFLGIKREHHGVAGSMLRRISHLIRAHPRKLPDSARV